MSAEYPRVVIVVINWNTPKDTLHCLEALEASDYPNSHVVVVDNGSTDGSADEILSRYPGMNLIRSPTNLGYTGGCNIGLRYAMDDGADYVWLLNNDAVVTPACLRTLVARAEADPRMGLLSPVVFFHDRPSEVQFVGFVLDPTSQNAIYLRSVEDAAGDGNSGHFVLMGTALLVRRAVVAAIGDLDDRYFAYDEDWDYSVRALQAGFEVALVRDAAVFHKPAGSLGPQSPVREYYVVRNRYLFWRSHLKGWPRRVYPARYLAWVLERNLNTPAAHRQVLVSAAFDGTWDALLGRFGPWREGTHMPPLLKRFLLWGPQVWHPHLWIGLLRGEFHVVSIEAARRALRKL